MRQIDFNGCNVKCYRYRTARVYGAYIDLDRRSRDCCILEDKLAKFANVSKDNHVVYEIEPKDGSAKMYVMCTDFRMRIGTKLEEGAW